MAEESSQSDTENGEDRLIESYCVCVCVCVWER